MAARGKPRTAGASGRHDYSGEQSLDFWRPIWRAEFNALPERKRQEHAAHVRELLRTAGRHSQLRAYAAICGITEDGDGDGSTQTTP